MGRAYKILPRYTYDLSPVTVFKHRYTKFHLYQSANIPYYILISPDTEEIENYETQESAYTHVKSGHALVHKFFLEDCNANIDFNKIWQ